MLTNKDIAQARALIVDDDKRLSQAIYRLLYARGVVHLDTAASGHEALNKLKTERFDVCVLDLIMPAMNGFEVLEEIQRLKIPTDVVVLTGAATTERVVRAIQCGAFDVLEKPFDPRKLVAAICRVFERRYTLPHVLAERLDKYLQDHFQQSGLSLSHICDHFHISDSYAMRLFREELQSTFRRRLVFHRLEHAKEQLTTTDSPFYQIAEQYGFKDYRRLYDAFVRMEGMTPTKYREICEGKRIK